MKKTIFFLFFFSNLFLTIFTERIGITGMVGTPVEMDLTDSDVQDEIKPVIQVKKKSPYQKKKISIFVFPF